MEKIKFSKQELKKRRDTLSQYQRYLPILYLKKQQLQFEILTQINLLNSLEKEFKIKKEEILKWLNLTIEDLDFVKKQISSYNVISEEKNIAGIDIKIFKKVEFAIFEYDLFLAPLWFDRGLDSLMDLVNIMENINTIRKNIELLKKELTITTQRLNLFEKIKIPQLEDEIRIIRIYLGDQFANSVGIAKIAKKKIEVGL